jgi:hypothetical protein
MSLQNPDRNDSHRLFGSQKLMTRQFWVCNENGVSGGFHQ